MDVGGGRGIVHAVDVRALGVEESMLSPDTDVECHEWVLWDIIGRTGNTSMKVDPLLFPSLLVYMIPGPYVTIEMKQSLCLPQRQHHLGYQHVLSHGHCQWQPWSSPPHHQHHLLLPPLDEAEVYCR